ncbi:GNAT family N-acetyltransferase [Halobacillus kuroshimensis]|uniref:GNAT family N-acetyltransferase n=1 Tax=Halobacillus kuroshimensis TaxID=302481 RepID=A0ABS3DWY9_9BACI|nr:GNAT family N-acetyltransferase [Halobacillus kuroshimensis]
MKTIGDLTIVEYHDGLAGSTAEMWNESRGEWGGDLVVTTAEDVKEKENASTNLNLFLALDGDKVVGYCGLSEYREDQEALYIPLLNVHPDYHGRKIGRELLKKAIDQTVAYGWPRLDLFTWPGNTKAVPLYKKCGFFWEERDDTTHLMNFIPQVLQMEVLRPFFQEHDWYSTSQRPIEVKPDGQKAGKHTVYEYKWQAPDGRFVRVQFERTGRGIHLIETEDFSIQMDLPDFKLRENETYATCIHIVNKQAAPATFHLEGVSSELVDHRVPMITTVEKEVTVNGEVGVTVPEQKPSPWKTHPVVEAVVHINGWSVPLKMGVYPIKAGNVTVRTVQPSWRPGQEDSLYLDLESHLENTSIWTVRLPDQNVLEWHTPSIQVDVDGGSRASVPVPITLRKNGFLKEEISVAVKEEGRPSFEFTAILSYAFPGHGAKFGGETETKWFGFNGPYYAEMEKRNQFIEVGSIRSNEDPVKLMTPHLGRPFSQEFSKKEASTVEFIELPEAFVLKTTLESQAFTGLLLNTYIKIFGDGVVEVHHEIINQGPAKESVHLQIPVYPMYKQLVIPYRDGVAVNREASIPFTEYLRDKEISEPWLFSKNSCGDTKALAWPEEARGRGDDWRFAIVYETGGLGEQEKRSLGPIKVGFNATADWKDWRSLVKGEDGKHLKEYPLFALEASGQRFISRAGERVPYTFRSLLTPYLHGSLTIRQDGETYREETTVEQKRTKMEIMMEHSSPGIHSIHGRFRSRGQAAALHTCQLVTGDEAVEVTNRNDVWTVNNGGFTFHASASYYPGIYSLVYEGQEMFHHQYPEAGPKSWWNPWGGGLRFALPEVSAYSMMKEDTRISRADRTDSLGHTWSGLLLSTTLQEHESMRGLTLRQYVLTLPGVPILAVFAEIAPPVHRTFYEEKVNLETFLKPGKELDSCYLKLPGSGVFHTYYAGVEEYELENTSAVWIGSDEHEKKMTFLHPQASKEAGSYVNQDVMYLESVQNWCAAEGGIFQTSPAFLYGGGEENTQAHHLFYGLAFPEKDSPS